MTPSSFPTDGASADPGAVHGSAPWDGLGTSWRPVGDGLGTARPKVRLSKPANIDAPARVIRASDSAVAHGGNAETRPMCSQPREEIHPSLSAFGLAR